MLVYQRVIHGYIGMIPIYSNNHGLCFFFFPVESDEMVTGELGNIGQLQAATSFDFPLVCYAPAASDWTRL